MKYYVIAVEAGATDIGLDGPFTSEQARDAAAKAIWAEMTPGYDNVFRAKVSADGKLSVGVYIEGELDD